MVFALRTDKAKYFVFKLRVKTKQRSLRREKFSESRLIEKFLRGSRRV
jgi:hypothetical protein